MVDGTKRRNLIIWNVASHDEQDAIAYFNKYKTEQNKARGDDEIIKLVDDRRLLKIEDENEGICGIAAFIGHETSSSDASEPIHVEMGLTVITANGLGLQVVTLRIRSLLAYIHYGPGCCIFSAADKSNGPSIHNLKQAGFKAWDDPSNWIKAKKLNKNPNLKMFKIEEPDLQQTALALLELDQLGAIDRTKKNGQFAYIKFPGQLLTGYRRYVEKIANGDFDIF